MRIVLISEFFPESSTDITGGVESRVFNIASELAKKHEVLVITSHRGRKRKYELEKIKIKRVGLRYPYTQTGHLIKRIIFSLCAGIAARKKADVVEGCSFFAYPSAFLATIFSNAKRFLTYHEVWIGNWTRNTNKKGVVGELSERIILLLSKLTKTKIIAVSGFTKGELEKQGIKNIEVVHNGVDLDEYKFRAKKYKKKTVAYVGRITKHKRLIDLINAAEKLDKLDFKIVGIGPEKEKLERTAPKNVKFLGFLDEHKDVLKVIKKSHIFCSPSVVEGFGITLLEAIACQTPFVCSDIPPYREVSKSKGGLFFKPKSPNELASQISKLIDDKKLYKSCVKEQKQIVKNYYWKNIAKQMEKIYSK
ncbi:MAG: Glycosyltransferase Gtf1 [Candidatus Woesearchaeota archaeon]|nr:Glycosyltransferase Gtf1 [Candidatus Woesearchaeota archaeon]